MKVVIDDEGSEEEQCEQFYDYCGSKLCSELHG